MLLRDNVYGTIEEDAERRDLPLTPCITNIKDFPCAMILAVG